MWWGALLMRGGDCCGVLNRVHLAGFPLSVCDPDLCVEKILGFRLFIAGKALYGPKKTRGLDAVLFPHAVRLAVCAQ